MEESVEKCAAKGCVRDACHHIWWDFTDVYVLLCSEHFNSLIANLEFIKQEPLVGYSDLRSLRQKEFDHLTDEFEKAVKSGRPGDKQRAGEIAGKLTSMHIDSVDQKIDASRFLALHGFLFGR